MDPETLAAAAARTLARDEAEAVAATVGIRHTRTHAADDPALASTVAASLSDGPRTVDPRSLPPIAIAEGEASDAADLTLGRVLGEGGMGIVVLARQRSLQRDVALKRVRRAGTNQAEALLREAAFSGYLEHPNIVPVHALGREGDGSPVLVMKRIEGTTLATLLHTPDHPAWDRAGDDRLGFVLRALGDVCDALSYAHARGVLHRDVKPENVMLGAFGEVYLLDWGVAVRKVDVLSDDAVVGTPVYMAPEMLAPGTHPLDERTDVYLVGAMLHEHLTGRPPHHGHDMAEVLLSVARAKAPTYPSSVPEELADIARRALHPDRAQRFPSAEALGRALSEFDRHRAAVALAQAALARLSELEAAIARGARPGETEPLFHECRFGFEQALRSWPENARARADLRRALVCMIGHHLDLENRAAAAALLASLESPPPDLVARLAALDAAADRDRVERERLRRLAHDLDPSVAEPQRRQAIRVVGVLLFAFALALTVSFALGRFVPSTRAMALIMIPGLLLVLVVAVRHRATFTKNRLNRQMLLTVITAVVVVGVNRFLGAIHQRALSEVVSADGLLIAALASVAAISFRRVYLVASALFLAAAIVAPTLGTLAFVPLLTAAIASVALAVKTPASLRRPLLDQADEP